MDEVGLEQIRDYIAALDQRAYAGSTIARRITVARGLHKFHDIAVGSEMNSSSAVDAIHQVQLSRVDDLVSTAEAQHRELATLEPFWKA